MPGDGTTRALEDEYARLRGQRQARLAAADAREARLAEIEASPTANEGWSRAEREWWQTRGVRGRRRAVDEQHAAWDEQLSANEPARRKLQTRIAASDDQRQALAAKHRDEIADIDRAGEELRDALHALEAVPPLEEA
jgi:chromosome segregation ATPase